MTAMRDGELCSDWLPRVVTAFAFGPLGRLKGRLEGRLARQLKELGVGKSEPRKCAERGVKSDLPQYLLSLL